MNLRAHGLVLLSTIFIAGSFIASDNLTNAANPIILNFIRFFCAALILAPIVLGKKALRQQIKAVLPRSMVISFFFSSYFVCLFSALQTTTALKTGTLYTLTPLVTAIVCIFAFKESLSKRRLAAYIIGAFGTLIVVFDGDISLIAGFSLNQGDYIFLLGVLLMSAYTTSLRLLYRKDSLLVLTFCTLTGGTIWMGLMIALTDISITALDFNTSNYFSIAYLVIFATLITSYLYQKASVSLSPSSVTSYIYLCPAFVAILSMFFYQEQITDAVWAGILISCGSTLLLQILTTEDVSYPKRVKI